LIALPVLILLGSSGTIWILRKGHIRIQWFIGLVGVGSAWICTFLIANQIPEALEFSIWKQENIFPTTFVLSLDEISWPLCMGIVSILLAIILTRPSREEIFDFREFIALLIFTGFAIMSVMAGNILSIVSIWMLMDGFIGALYLRTDKRNKATSRVIWWFTKNLVSIFLMILAFVLNISQSGKAPFVNGELSSSVIFLVIISSLLRLPFLSIARNADQIGWLDLGSRTVLDLYPAITGIAVLGQLFHLGVPVETLLVIRLVSVIILVLSALYIVFYMNFKPSSLVFFLGLVGIGIMAETYFVIKPGLLIVTTGVLGLFIVSTTNFIKIYEKWNLFFPITVSAMLIGMPGSPGVLLARGIVDIFLSEKAIGIGLLLATSLMFLDIVLLKSFLERREEWISSDKLTRMSYFSGIILFACSGILIGVTMQKDYTLPDTSIFLIMLILVGVIYLGSTKARIKKPIKPRIHSHLINMAFDFTLEVGRYLLDIIRGVGKLFESETGMLWTFVILQLLVLAFVNMGL